LVPTLPRECTLLVPLFSTVVSHGEVSIEFGIFNIFCRFRYAKCTLTIASTRSRIVIVTTILWAFLSGRKLSGVTPRITPRQQKIIDPQFGVAVGVGVAHRRRRRWPPPDAAAKKLRHRLRLHLLTPPPLSRSLYFATGRTATAGSVVVVRPPVVNDDVVASSEEVGGREEGSRTQGGRRSRRWGKKAEGGDESGGVPFSPASSS
jgi:hypothetical protein